MTSPFTDEQLERMATMHSPGIPLGDLARELLEARRDARRMDWLEAKHAEHSAIWIMPCGDDKTFVQIRHMASYEGGVDNYPTVDGKLREAIDAALAEGK